MVKCGQVLKKERYVWWSVTLWHDRGFVDPFGRREAPTEGRRPAGEGANLDWHLVHHHGKCERIPSRIEFIYIFIHMCGTRSFLRRRAKVGYCSNTQKARVNETWAVGNSIGREDRSLQEQVWRKYECLDNRLRQLNNEQSESRCSTQSKNGWESQERGE